MTLGHEKLDVYVRSIDYVAWGYEAWERFLEEMTSVQSTEPMRSIPIAISIPMKENFNQTVEATPNGVPHF